MLANVLDKRSYRKGLLLESVLEVKKEVSQHNEIIRMEKVGSKTR